MKKILIIIPIILLVLYWALFWHIYTDKNDASIKKFIEYALKNEDVEFNTKLNNTKYVCYFGSLYSIHSIKPELTKINADYSPAIGLKMQLMRVGEGASAVVIVKNNGRILPVYLHAYSIITDDTLQLEQRCAPHDTVNLKVKNKKLYIKH